MTIKLPWPHPDLSPNARVHRMEKARRAKHARETAGWLCKGAKVQKSTASALRVTITFHPPDKRHRDTDNMLASCKAALDGVSDALGIYDSKWTLTLQRGEPVPDGCVLFDYQDAPEMVLIPFRGQIS